MSDRDTGGCLLIILVALAVWPVAKAVQWLGEGFRMSLVGAVVALLLLAWLWACPPRGPCSPTRPATGAVLAGAAAAKPLGLFWSLAALYAALTGFTFSLGLGYGLLGLLLGGFGFSLIGWSWWRPFRLRIGPRLHLPWWCTLQPRAAWPPLRALLLSATSPGRPPTRPTGGPGRFTPISLGPTAH